MTGVNSVRGVALSVPDIATGVKFYTDAGLEVEMRDGRAHLRCKGQERDAFVLIPGSGRKKLHHITLVAPESAFNDIRKNTLANGGEIIDALDKFSNDGVWLRDPHGLVIHIVDGPAEKPLTPVTPFTINEPGRIVRKNRSAMLKKTAYPPAKPLRLGHILLFTPDVMRSISFFEKALGMGLADRAEDIVAFMCGRSGSDHHVVAFAKAGGVGFHHASFQVASPDEVGLNGRRLLEKSKRGDWGFGRHTIGSNFFHYIQDPWGSWFEYYSDMDYVEDYKLWTPTNYGLEDSLENWGPPLPKDFVHNYECAPKAFGEE